MELHQSSVRYELQSDEYLSNLPTIQKNQRIVHIEV